MSVLNPTTSTTRPSNPSDGELFFETDTRKLLLWDGSAWREYDNTSGATSGGGTGDSGSGTGDSGSGTGDSGSGTGDTGGTTPGAGINTDTGITDAVAQPGSGHDDSNRLGNDTSAEGIYSLDTNNGAVLFQQSTSRIDVATNGRLQWTNFANFTNKIVSMWVRFDDDFDTHANYSSFNGYGQYLWYTLPKAGISTSQRGVDYTYGQIWYDSSSKTQKFWVHTEGLSSIPDLIINDLHPASENNVLPPYNPMVAHNAEGGEIRTGQNEPSGVEWQVMEQPFHKDRWYHIVLNWHRDDPLDWQDSSKIQYIDLWLDGVKQSTAKVRTNPNTLLQWNNSGTPFVDNFMIGGSVSDDDDYVQRSGVSHGSDRNFPGVIQRFTMYDFTSNDTSHRIFDDDIKALYAKGPENTNPVDFKTGFVQNTILTAHDVRMGDDNVFPGAGNSIPIKRWRRQGLSSGDSDPIINETRSFFVPSVASESFKYVSATYDKPYTFGIGTWKGQEYSDGILDTGYKTNMANGASLIMWVNISDVDRAGIQYLFGSKNSPSANDRDGNNPDQFAIGVEQHLGSTACRFKLYFMQEDVARAEFSVQSEEWACIGLVVDTANDSVVWYKNGTQRQTYSSITSRYSGFQLPPFYIGDANGGNDAMQGLISRIHYYDGVWTHTEMQEFYKAGPGAPGQAHPSKSTLDYKLDGRLTNTGGSSSLYPKLTYTGTGQPKYARNRPY